ncbi:hypothetical protein V8C35DRAFT_285588 [Trichoderma chlorosporum]
MIETRAQRAAKRACIPEEQDQKAPRSKRQRQDACPESPREPTILGENRKRTIDNTQDPAAQSPAKRSRKSSQLTEDRLDDVADRRWTHPIGFWVEKGHWPREYLMAGMEHVLARKRSLFSLRRKRSDSASSVTPSDQRPREEKSAAYRDSRYESLLKTKGCYMQNSKEGIMDESKQICRDLIEKQQQVPQGSIFDDAVFAQACQNIQDEGEARVIQDISRLLVPSAETLALYTKHLAILKESVNAGWNNSVPLTGTRPQPDYSVGFRREAFTSDQLAKLSPFIGDFIAGDLSFFMATYSMHFPFFSCEVKCGAGALHVADRQNAHSMALAARGIVELFRLVKRENEINRQVLSFSISHDDRIVRIYGYYPVIDGKDTNYYRHPIHEFSFTALNGEKKWTAYQFTKNIYDIWMPTHLQRIRSAIDQLPSEINFDVPALSESTGLSQGLESLGRVDGSNQPHGAGEMDSPATTFAKPAPPSKRMKPNVNAFESSASVENADNNNKTTV